MANEQASTNSAEQIIDELVEVMLNLIRNVRQISEQRMELRVTPTCVHGANRALARAKSFRQGGVR
jgi:hypothetical protein